MFVGYFTFCSQDSARKCTYVSLVNTILLGSTNHSIYLAKVFLFGTIILNRSVLFLLAGFPG